MPVKYSIKTYVADGYYHVFSRGVEKREIFLDDRDYQAFLSFMEEYLEPRNNALIQKDIVDSTLHYKRRRSAVRKLNRKNFTSDIKLFAYCLMGNHFHLLIQQRSSNSMQEFMRALLTRYSMYFNKKYKRTGSLFESSYKAVQVQSDVQLLELTRYIHRNPHKIDYPYSSYGQYVSPGKNSTWLNTELVLSFFSQRHPNLLYTAFVSQNTDREIFKLTGILLDN